MNALHAPIPRPPMEITFREAVNSICSQADVSLAARSKLLFGLIYFTPAVHQAEASTYIHSMLFRNT